VESPGPGCCPFVFESSWCITVLASVAPKEHLAPRSRAWLELHGRIVGVPFIDADCGLKRRHPSALFKSTLGRLSARLLNEPVKYSKVGIPAKLNAHSERKPNGIPG
jgi:hypothetical protein